MHLLVSSTYRISLMDGHGLVKISHIARSFFLFPVSLTLDL